MRPMDIHVQNTPDIVEEQAEQTSEEPLYRVIIHNDDITPMVLVIQVLKSIFLIPNPAALHVMYTAHLHGSAFVQTLPKVEAQKRINKAHFAAHMKNYPLKFTMEPE